MHPMLDTPNNNVKRIERFFCHDVRMSLQKRINELFLSKPEATNAELARFVGCSRATVTDWRNGKTKEIEGRNAFKVAAFFGANPEWVQSGKGNKLIEHAKAVRKYSELEPHPLIKSHPSVRIPLHQIIQGEVPFLTALQAVDWKSSIDQAKNDKDWKMVAVKVQVHDYTFVTQVCGDSMEPEFIDGEIITIEPELTPEHRNFVLVNMGGDVCIRQYWREAGEWLLKPLNDRYLTKPLANNEIIGVIRDKTKTYL